MSFLSDFEAIPANRGARKSSKTSAYKPHSFDAFNNDCLDDSGNVRKDSECCVTGGQDNSVTCASIFEALYAENIHGITIPHPSLVRPKMIIPLVELEGVSKITSAVPLFRASEWKLNSLLPPPLWIDKAEVEILEKYSCAAELVDIITTNGFLGTIYMDVLRQTFNLVVNLVHPSGFSDFQLTKTKMIGFLLYIERVLYLRIKYYGDGFVTPSIEDKSEQITRILVRDKKFVAAVQKIRYAIKYFEDLIPKKPEDIKKKRAHTVFYNSGITKDSSNTETAFVEYVSSRLKTMVPDSWESDFGDLKTALKIAKKDLVEKQHKLAALETTIYIRTHENLPPDGEWGVYTELSVEASQKYLSPSDLKKYAALAQRQSEIENQVMAIVLELDKHGKGMEDGQVQKTSELERIIAGGKKRIESARNEVREIRRKMIEYINIVGDASHKDHVHAFPPITPQQANLVLKNEKEKVTYMTALTNYDHASSECERITTYIHQVADAVETNAILEIMNYSKLATELLCFGQKYIPWAKGNPIELLISPTAHVCFVSLMSTIGHLLGAYACEGHKYSRTDRISLLRAISFLNKREMKTPEDLREYINDLSKILSGTYTQNGARIEIPPVQEKGLFEQLYAKDAGVRAAECFAILG